MIATVSAVTAAAAAAASVKGTCEKQSTAGGPNPALILSWPVAAMPASVRPWKESWAVRMPYLVCCNK